MNLAFLVFALAGFSAVLITHFSSSTAYRINDFWLAVLSIYVITSVTAAGYVINDYFDQDTDRINKPHKLVVGRLMSARDVQWLYLGLLFESVLFAIAVFWFTNQYFFVWAVFLVHIALFVYAARLKKSMLFGNVLVAFLTVAPYALLFLLFDPKHEALPLLVFLSSSGFFLNLSREIAKDWEDIPGDKATGARTFPIVYGEQFTRKILLGVSVFSLVLHSILVVIYAQSEQCPENFFFVVSPLLLYFAFQIILTMRIAQDKVLPKEISSWLKWIMFLGVVWIYTLWLFL